MKAILTLIFVLLIGTAAQAKDAKGEIKVSAVTMGITNIDTVIFNGVAPTEHGQVARLYRNKNSKVLRALNFSTRKNMAKLA
jgi:hypothetical protein